MSTQEPSYGTTGERLRAFAVNEDSRERLGLLAARYWEIGAYGLLLMSAAVLRFFNLGARAMHHDESLHGYFSYGFTKGLKQVFTFNSQNIDTYKHVPFMHGPFQFIGSGFMMWIFGDGEYQARLLAAIMGTALVALPFLLRNQIGKFGALATAMFICFSPTLLYYSRFTREDIYTAFWTFGLVIFTWRYMVSRENKFLYLTAGFMAGLFLTKEVSYMFVAAFILFFDFLFAQHIVDKIRAKKPDMRDAERVLLTVAFTAMAIPIAVAWPFIEDWRRKYELDEMPPEANLVVVMGTLALPMYAAAVQLLPGFGETWQNRPGETNDSHIAGAEFQVALISMYGLMGLSLAIGLLWRPQTWLIAAACFWGPVFLLSTTFIFSNLPGFHSVVWGSLDYWISQQDVRRGNQPDYYYFVTIPVYEFLTLGLSIAAMLYYTIRGNLRNAAIVGVGLLLIVVLLILPPGPGILKCTAESCPPEARDGTSILHILLPFSIVVLAVFAFPMERLTRFLIYWLVITAFALTVAGEKMPWLNVHIALPLAVLAGRFVGDLVNRSDLRADLPKLERLAPFAYSAIASALAILVFVVVGWRIWDAPEAIGGWILVIVAGVALYWAATEYSRATAMQVALAGVVAAFSVFSLRAGVLASWGHPDNPHKGDVAERDYGEVPIELLVYTQTSGDIPVLRDEIDKVARESGQGENLPIIIDDGAAGFTWPWAWYLRNYKSVDYPTISSGYAPPPVAVLLISKENAVGLNLGGNYAEGVPYHHRRWFPEEYRGKDGVYSARDFFGDLFTPSALGNWLDYWVRRTPPNELGTVDGVAFFPKGYETLTAPPAGPTVRTEGTQLVIGSSGAALGQLTAPSDVALDAAGNIYIADTNNNRIQKYDAQGQYVAFAGGFGSADVSLTQPWSMVVAPDGTVFVADTWAHTIVKLDANLKLVKEWGGPGQAERDGDPFALFGPREITLTADGNLLVADTGNNRIIEYDQEGEAVRQFGGKGTSGAPLDLNEPVGIVAAPNGDIYIADFWNKRIVHLGSDLGSKGQIDVPSWGSQAVTDRPYMVQLADGRLLATDPTRGKVLTFSADGALLGEYDMPKEGAAPTARPIGIAADGTSVVIVDSVGNVARKIPLAEVAK